MKLNRKGMTLIEIIISVGLISLVMVFLLRLLVDIRKEQADTAVAYKDSTSRNEIITLIQNELEDQQLISFDFANIDDRKVSINIGAEGSNVITKTLTITIGEDYKSLSLVIPDKETRKWTFADETARYEICGIQSEYVTGDNVNSHYYTRLLIPVVFSSSKEDSSSYDIEVSYIGKKFSGIVPGSFQKERNCSAE